MADEKETSGLDRALAHCTAGDLRLLAGVAERLRFAPGETVVAEGSPVTGLYVLRGGCVRFATRDPARTTLLGTLEPDDVFGAGALLEQGRAPVSLIATTPVEVDRIDGDALAELVNVHPDLAVRVYRSIAAAVARRLERMLAQLGPRSGRPGDAPADPYAV